MTTYNTGNPVGSSDPRDLYDNAENLDNLVNGDQAAYNDRLGKSRRSWQSVEDQVNQQEVEFNADQSARDSQFAADQQIRETTFTNFLNSSGFEYLGEYAAGITFTEYNQYVVSAGEAWFISTSTALPYTTTGAALPEGGALMSRGEAVLRQEIGSGIRRVDSLAGLQAITGRFSGDVAYMVGRTTAGDGGEGEFRWDGSDLSSTMVTLTAPTESVDDTTDIITDAAHGLYNGAGVTVDTSVNGLTANALYWVVGATTDTYQLSETFGGPAIDLTGTTNFTTYQLLDPLQGVYTADDRTGTGGAWVRQFDGSLSVLWFGAAGDWDGTSGTDNSAPFFCAFNFKIREDFSSAYGPGVFIPQPKGQYFCSSEINLKTKNRIHGVGSGIEGENTSSIVFAKDSNGIIVNRYNTFSDGVQGTPTKGADGTIIEGITIKSLGGSSGDGLWLRARAVVRDCRILSFPGIGLKIVASSGASAPLEGNANNFSVSNMRISNCGSHGVYVNGADANAGLGLAIDSSANGGDGIFDSSFLGNTWVGCHVNGNSTGSYRSDNVNARNVWIGCYREVGGPGNSISRTDIVLGGMFGPYSGGVDIRDDSILMPEESDISTSYGVFSAPNSYAHQGVKIRNNSSFSSSRSASVNFFAGNETDMPGGVPLASIYGRAETSASSKQRLGFSIYDGSTGSLFNALNLRYVGGAALYPEQDNTLALGKSSNRYTEVFAAAGTINTSDEREKTELLPLDDREQAAAKECKGLIRKFKFKDAVNKKGESARWHFGVGAQSVAEVFRKHGLNADDYALFCYDEWQEQPEVKDEDDNVVQEYQPAGNRYGIRYEELLAFIISAM